ISGVCQASRSSRGGANPLSARAARRGMVPASFFGSDVGKRCGRSSYRQVAWRDREMNRLHYGWVIVAAGALITCVAMGAMFALPVYLQPMAEETGWTRAGISMAMTVGFLVMGVAGFGWGTLTDRIGARPVVLIAAVLLGAG